MVLGKIFIIFCYPPPFSMVLFCDSCSMGPKVSPALVLILATGSLLVPLCSHHVTVTLSPSASIIATTKSALWCCLVYPFAKCGTVVGGTPKHTLSLPVLFDHHATDVFTRFQWRLPFGPDRQRLFLPHLVVAPGVLLLHVIAKITPKTNNTFKGNRTPLIYRFKPIEMI